MAALNIHTFENEPQNGPGMCRRWYQIHSLYNMNARYINTISVMIGDDPGQMRSSIVGAGIVGDCFLFFKTQKLISLHHCRAAKVGKRWVALCLIAKPRSARACRRLGAVDTFCGLEIL